MSLTDKLSQGDRAAERLIARKERDLIRAYNEALKAVRGELAQFYSRYGDLSYAQMNQYNRLANLEKEISREIAKLTGKNALTLKSGLGQVFAESFYRTAYALETEVGAKLGFGMLNPKVIEAAVENPLDRVGFLKRNRDNQARLVRQMQEQLTQGLIRGESYQKVANRLKDRMEVGAGNAIRIAQTEMHRCQVQGRVEAFDHSEDYGLEEKRIWVSTLDGDTREDHQEMDGEKADEEGYFELPDGARGRGPGLIGEPHHDINCRCTIRVEIVGFGPKVRRAREVEGRTGEIRSYTTYKKWKEGRVKQE